MKTPFCTSSESSPLVSWGPVPWPLCQGVVSGEHETPLSTLPSEKLLCVMGLPIGKWWGEMNTGGSITQPQIWGIPEGRDVVLTLLLP